MKLQRLLYVLVVFCACASNASKILVIFPLMGKSHSILGEGVVHHLLNAGHEVTYIQGFEMKSHPNLTQIRPKAALEYVDEGLDVEKIVKKEFDLQDTGVVLYIMNMYANTVVADEVVQNFLKDTSQQFDLVIAEWMFSNIYSAFHAVYGCPLIWVSTVEPHWQALRIIDEPLNPAYNPDTMSSIIPPFSFFDRVNELIIQIKTMLADNYFMEQQRKLYETSFAPHIKLRGREVPDYDGLGYNASLMFGNSHVSLGQAIRLPANYINIGGYHITSKAKPLPADLQKLLDNAKDGLIYFSMGSNLRSKYIPQSIKEQILRVFGELKQTVLWKFEEKIANLPKNVHIVDWAPQLSILSHPNTVLFITHGGLLSTIETIHVGKPIIGIPIFADQFINVERAVLKGFAKKVDFSYDMENDLRSAIKEILGNPKYARNVKEWSMIYHDRTVSPAKELIHWTEHVIKTRGAKHLRSAALIVPWYQKMYLDLLLVLFIILIIIILILKAAWNYLKSFKSDKKKKQ